MASPVPENKDIESTLRIALELARQEFDDAKLALRQVSAAPSADGKPNAIENALVKHNLASENFGLALRRFSDFLLTRGPPGYR
jgi:hypothetical protein